MERIARKNLLTIPHGDDNFSMQAGRHVGL